MARAATAPQEAAARPSLRHAVGYGARPRQSAPPGLPAVPRARDAHTSQQIDVRPAPYSSEWTHPHTGYESAVSHVTRRKGGAGRKPTHALWVRVFRARGPGFRGWPNVRSRLGRPPLPEAQAGTLNRPSEPLLYCTLCGVERSPHSDARPPPGTSTNSISAPRTGSSGSGCLCV